MILLLVFGIQTLLVVNIAYHFIKYVRVQSFKPVELSVTEKKLCRISENGLCDDFLLIIN